MIQTREAALTFLLFTLFGYALSAQELTDGHRAKHAQSLELQKEGQWREALVVSDELATAFIDSPPSQHKLVFTNEQANLNQRLGYYAEAEAGYLSCLEIAAAITSEDSNLIGKLKNNLSALYVNLGRFEEAEALSREALSIREGNDGKGSVSVVPAMNNLATLLAELGDREGAETLYRKSLEIRLSELGENSIETARSRANLGGLLYLIDQNDEAERLVRAALHTFELESGPDHPDTLEVVLFLGEVERALERPELALQLYERVRDGRIAAFGDVPHLETAEAERRVGDAMREMGDYAGALDSYTRSELLYEGSLRPGHPDLLHGLYGAGLAALASGKNSLAREKADACSEIELSHLAAVLEFTDERQRLAYQSLYRSHHLFANLKDARGVAEFLLRRKGVVFDSLISEARLMSRAKTAEQVDATIELENARARLRSSFLSTDPSSIDLEEAQEEVRTALRRLMDATGDVGFKNESVDLDLRDLQDALPEGEVLIDYLTFDAYLGEANFQEHIGAAVVSRDSVHFVDCGPLSEVSGLITESIVFFGEMRPDDDLADTILRKFYGTLIAPILPHLGEAALVHVSPEGPLNFVPFACLLDAEGKFLIERFNIGYVSAARELLTPAQPVAPTRGAFLIGNPKFDTNRDESGETISDRRGLLTNFSSGILIQLSSALTPLSGAEKEVQHLSNLLTDLSIPVEAVYGTDATETAMRTKAIQPYLLHIATHGVYLPALMPVPDETNKGQNFVPKEVAGFQNPLFGSWITLTGSGNTIQAWSEGQVPTPANDGILMANEAAELNLNGTLVVTLSACDTASGEATSGDGVLGIRRGFRIAGAEHIMSTLWPISDAMTPKIMSDFYSGLPSTTPTESLNEAQREWLTAIRDDPSAVTLPLSDGTQVDVGGLYWAVNLAGPFLLSR